MKKEEIYELRDLFHQILNDYKNDVSTECRAMKIYDSVEKGVEICNRSINKMKPL